MATYQHLLRGLAAAATTKVAALLTTQRRPRRTAKGRRHSAYAGFDELEGGTGVPSYDAAVQFAAIPAILGRPDNETFRINALSTYNVIDAATKLGIGKVISENPITSATIGCPVVRDGTVLPSR